MLTRPLLELIFEAASMQRWNDHLHPRGGFTELDKQAHKMFLTWVLGRFEENRATVDWTKIISGGFFEFIQRVILTDIKRPIFYKIIQDRENEVRLKKWVIQTARNRLQHFPPEFFLDFENYLLAGDDSLERKILNAAHYLATDWEFRIIYQMNPGTMGIEQTKAELENEIEEHYDLLGVQKILLGKKTADFVNLVGQLRFQQRWAQSPRVPETSVMGHMLVVALLSYIASLQVGACNRRIYNNFYGGLFHDLPEVMTRDIISPVKRSFEGLEELIKEIEKRQIEEAILPLLPPAWHREILYFVDNEFASKILTENTISTVTSTLINTKYNDDHYSPLDGEMIEACDKLSAYIEASLSIQHGVKSHHLAEARDKLLDRFNNHTVGGVDFGRLFAQFAD